MTQEPQSNPFGEGLSEQAAHRYKRVRPGYPPEAVREISSCLPRGGRVADLGAGTGQLTRSLIKEGFGVIAVEPSASMRAALTSEPWANTANLEVRPTLAEDTGIEACSVDAVVWADSFHWLNAKEAAGEAGRILKRNGLAFLLANQLDVSKPWVHRLSRIMRSGDVLRNVPRVSWARSSPRLPSGSGSGSKHFSPQTCWNSQRRAVPTCDQTRSRANACKRTLTGTCTATWGSPGPRK